MHPSGPRTALLAAAHAAFVPVEQPSANAFAAALCRLEAVQPSNLTHWKDLAVAHAALDGEAGAQRLLEQAMLEAVLGLKTRSRHRPHLVDDAAQRLRERLLVPSEGRPARLVQYAGKGPLAGFLRAALAREVLSLERLHTREVPLPDDALLEGTAHKDPELAMLQAAQRPLVRDAFRLAFAALPQKDRTLLQLAYVHGMTVDDLGRANNVHRATAARWLARARAELLSSTRAALQQHLGAPPDDVDSLLRLVQSNLSLSLGWTKPPS
jgi:RNA polymerase sigma-70 factor (ECF subfamily)